MEKTSINLLVASRTRPNQGSNRQPFGVLSRQAGAGSAFKRWSKVEAREQGRKEAGGGRRQLYSVQREGYGRSNQWAKAVLRGHVRLLTSGDVSVSLSAPHCGLSRGLGGSVCPGNHQASDKHQP